MLAAHFLRAGNLFLVIAILLLPFGLFIRKAVVVRLIQVALIFGAIEWMRTTFLLAALRIQNNLPWVRLVVILGLVALFTLASTLVFLSKTLKRRYGLI